MADKLYSYAAFISYSTFDKKWAAWLHRALETYKVPADLVGTQGEYGLVPKRIYPVFRDRDELASSEDLGGAIQQALEESRHLIVLCSQHAAASRWVNKEIETYRTFNGRRPISCLLIADDAESLKQELGTPSFIPKTLFESQSGVASEPLAADVRKAGDGKARAKLKIISAVLGVKFDQLQRREQRRRRTRNTWAAISAMIATIIGVLIAVAFFRTLMERTEAERRELVRISQDRLNAGFPDEAMLFSLHALPTKGDLTSDAGYSTLRGALEKTRKFREFELSSPPSLPLLSQTGIYAFTATEQAGVVWSTHDGEQQLLIEDAGPITAAAFHPDGERVAIAFEPEEEERSCVSCSRFIDLWNITTKTREWRFKTLGHIERLTFSKDGKWLAAATQGGAVVLELTDQRRVRFLQHRPVPQLIYPIFDVEFDDTGTSVITLGKDKTATIWNVETGDTKAILQHDGPVKTGVFAPGGEHVLTVTETGDAILWKQLSEDTHLRASDNSPILVGRFGPGPENITTISANAVDIWNLEDLKQPLESLRMPNKTTMAELNATGSLALIASSNSAELWSLATKKRISVLKHRDLITGISFDSLDNQVITSSMDLSSAIWNISGYLERDKMDFSGEIIALSANDQHELAVVWVGGIAFEVWDLQSRKLVSRLPYEPEGMWCRAGLSPKLTRLVTTCDHGGVAVWDLGTSRQIAEFDDFDSIVWNAACGGDECSHVIVPTAAGLVQEIDVQTGGVVRHHDGITSMNIVTFSDDGRYFLAQNTRRKTVQLWNVATLTPTTLEIEYDGVRKGSVFDPSGQILVTAFSDEKLNFWDADTGSGIDYLTLVGSQRLSDPSRSYYGEDILAEISDNEFIVYGEPYRVASPDSSRVVSLAISYSKRYVATVSDDGRVAIWDRTEGVLVDEFEFAAEPKRVAFSNSDDVLLISLGRSVIRRPLLFDASLSDFARKSLPHGGNCLIPADLERFSVPTRSALRRAREDCGPRTRVNN